MNSRLTVCLIAIFSIIHIASGSFDEEDLEVSRSVDPKVLSRLESRFLKLFGMEKRPARSKSSIKIPRYLVELYKSQTGLELPTSNLHLPGKHTRTANTVRTFYPPTPALRFDLSAIPAAEEVTGAEVRILINRTQLAEAYGPMFRVGPVRVIINDVVKLSAQGEQIMYPVDSKFVDLSKRSEVFSIMLDVFPAVARWIAAEKKNRGLVVQVFDEAGHVQIPWTWDFENRRDSPTLFTYSDDGVHKRKTRDAKTLSRHYRAAVQERRNNKNRKHKNKNRKRNLCAKHTMFVDFTDVGWNDWIVAPPGYHAYHCSGECPFPMAEHLNATNHAVIQALVNSMNPQQVPPPCCVPTKYSSLSLLYADAEEKIVLKNYNEMIVDSCGCS